MRVRSPASAGSLLALAVTIALAAVTAALVTPSLAMAAGAVGGDRGGPPDAPPSARLSVFRMDVSHYPAIGLVITVPGVRGPLCNRDTVVISGATAVHPAVHQLSPADVELVLAPDTGLQPAAMRAEQGAATLFLASLPGGTQTAAVNPSRLGVLAHGLTRDPAVSVAEVATLTRTRSTAAARLATALSAFSRGSTVRRTVVLVVSGGRALGAKAEARFRQRLVASGTALYVLDATASGSTAYDSLATESGGLALRVRAPGSWSSAFSHVTSDLAGQYYLRFADTMRVIQAVR